MGLNFYSVRLDSSEYPEDEKINRALSLMLNEELRPTLVHCFHGKDRTGLVVGLYRVEQQGWEAEEAYEEMVDIGFMTSLYRLDRYFKRRTGMLSEREFSGKISL